MGRHEAPFEAGETLEDLAAVMRGDALAFAQTMATKAVNFEVAYQEMSRSQEMQGTAYPVCFWILRAKKYGSQKPMAAQCASVREYAAMGSSNFAVLRAAGLDLQTNLDELDRRTGWEPQLLAIRTDGNIAVVTEHSHGHPPYQKRLTMGQLYPNRFIDDSLTNDSTGQSQAYADWQADLRAAEAAYAK